MKILTYFSMSFFLLRIFMVLLSSPRNVKPYLQLEINHHRSSLLVIIKLYQPISQFNLYPLLKHVCSIKTRLMSVQFIKASQPISHLIAPFTRATSSGEEAIKPLCSCSEWDTPPSTSKLSTWSTIPSSLLWPCFVDSFTWTVWQRHRARRNNSSFS